jgi:hypothetical protein
MKYAISGRRLAGDTWRTFERNVRQTVLANAHLAEIDPASEYTERSQAAILSQQARLLAATGDSDALREADRLEKLAARHAEQLPYPYGKLFPIQRDILRGKLRTAVTKCERAIEAFDNAGNIPSAAAFAALLLQLTELNRGNVTVDQSTVRSARTAITSPSIWYRCSHVFDLQIVRKLIYLSPLQ